MTDATQPRMARGRMLSAGILVAALFALLAFAPIASATPDPVGSGTTKITLNKNWTKYLKTFGIKVQKIGKAKVNGTEGRSSRSAQWRQDGPDQRPRPLSSSAAASSSRTARSTAPLKALEMQTNKDKSWSARSAARR